MSFIQEFLMCSGEAYTVYNTLAYAVIFLFLLTGISRLFQKLELKIKADFYLAILPLMLAGPTVRVMLDAGAYKKIIFNSCAVLNTTIGISVVLLTAGVLSLLIADMLSKRGFGLYRSFGAVNLLFFFSYHLLYFGPSTDIFFSASILTASKILAYAFAASLLFYLFAKKFWAFFLDAGNYLLVVVHIFDASTTFVGLQTGYSEQQVLPSLLIGIFGPYAIFAVKLLIVPAAVYLLRKEKDKDLLYFGVFLLGFAPAARNFLRIVLGV